MIQSISNFRRCFSNSTVTSVIRNETPFESHLSSATVKYRQLNASDPQPNDLSSSCDKGVDQVLVGGRIKRKYIQKLSAEKTELPAVGGRIIRAAPKATSQFESNGWNAVPTMNATAKLRQRHNYGTDLPSQEVTLISSNKGMEIKALEGDDDKSEKKSFPTTSILALGGAIGISYSGIIPF